MLLPLLLLHLQRLLMAATHPTSSVAVAVAVAVAVVCEVGAPRREAEAYRRRHKGRFLRGRDRLWPIGGIGIGRPLTTSLRHQQQQQQQQAAEGGSAAAAAADTIQREIQEEAVEDEARIGSRALDAAYWCGGEEPQPQPPLLSFHHLRHHHPIAMHQVAMAPGRSVAALEEVVLEVESSTRGGGTRSGRRENRDDDCVPSATSSESSILAPAAAAAAPSPADGTANNGNGKATAATATATATAAATAAAATITIRDGDSVPW